MSATAAWDMMLGISLQNVESVRVPQPAVPRGVKADVDPPSRRETHQDVPHLSREVVCGGDTACACEAPPRSGLAGRKSGPPRALRGRARPGALLLVPKVEQGLVQHVPQSRVSCEHKPSVLRVVQRRDEGEVGVVGPEGRGHPRHEPRAEVHGLHVAQVMREVVDVERDEVGIQHSQRSQQPRPGLLILIAELRVPAEHRGVIDRRDVALRWRRAVVAGSFSRREQGGPHPDLLPGDGEVLGSLEKLEEGRVLGVRMRAADEQAVGVGIR